MKSKSSKQITINGLFIASMVKYRLPRKLKKRLNKLKAGNIGVKAWRHSESQLRAFRNQFNSNIEKHWLDFKKAYDQDKLKPPGGTIAISDQNIEK